MDFCSIALYLFIGLLSVVYLFFKRRYNYWKDRGIPYVIPTIPLGNVPFKLNIEPRELAKEFYEKKTDNVMMGGFIFAQPILVATHLDFVQNVLVKDFSSFHDRGIYVNEEDDPLSGHMFSVDGEKWKMLRSKLSPTFTSGKMKLMFPTVVEIADRFDALLDNIIGENGKMLELKDLLARFTTDVIGTCAFGIECNSLKNPDSEFRNYGRKIFEQPHLSIFMQLFVMMCPNLAKKFHIRLFRKEVSDFFMGTVRETIDYREKNNVRRNDFMDLLIRLMHGKSIDDETKTVGKLTFEEVAAQAFIFFIGGFETSSTTLMFALYELALNLDVQEKARDEIERVLGNHNGKLTYEAVNDMTYVDQIITETLRKYPPLVSLNRQCTRTYKVPNTNYIIDKDTVVVVPVYYIHRDPEIYSDPEVFDPDRFTPEQIKSRHPLSFLGFGDGPRNCVGLRFGRMQSRIGLITLLKNYRFKPSPKTLIPMVFDKKSGMLSPEGGMYLNVEKV